MTEQQLIADLQRWLFICECQSRYDAEQQKQSIEIIQTTWWNEWNHAQHYQAHHGSPK
jgi:hypothetical protein